MKTTIYVTLAALGLLVSSSCVEPTTSDNALKNPISETGFQCAPDTPPALCDLEEGRELDEDIEGNNGVPGESGDAVECTAQDCAAGERCVTLAGWSPESGAALTANDSIARGGYCYATCSVDADCAIGESCQVTYVESWDDGEGTCWPQDNCGDLDFIGECSGDTLRWCNYGFLTEADCGERGQVCGEDDNPDVGFNCIDDESCVVDDDCPIGFGCFDGACARGPACETHEECGVGFYCGEGACQASVSCSADEECRATACVDGFCEPFDD